MMKRRRRKRKRENYRKSKKYWIKKYRMKAKFKIAKIVNLKIILWT